MGYFLQSLVVLLLLFTITSPAFAQNERVKLVKTDKTSPALAEEESIKPQLKEDKKEEQSQIQNINLDKKNTGIQNSAKQLKHIDLPVQSSGLQSDQELLNTHLNKDKINPQTDERYRHETAPIFPDLNVTAIKEDVPVESINSAEIKPKKLEKINNSIAEDVIIEDALSRQSSISPEKRKYIEEQAARLQQEIQALPNKNSTELKAKKQELMELVKFLSDYK